MTNLCSETNKRHVGVTHRHEVSKLFVEGTHFPRPLGLLWLWVQLFSRYLQKDLLVMDAPVQMLHTNTGPV